MPTINQLIRKRRISTEDEVEVSGAGWGCPRRRGVCYRVWTSNAQKPKFGVCAEKSGSRSPARQGLKVTGYIPGIGHNLQEHSIVLLRGGKVGDLPGVHYPRRFVVCSMQPALKITSSSARSTAPSGPEVRRVGPGFAGCEGLGRRISTSEPRGWSDPWAC